MPRSRLPRLSSIKDGSFEPSRRNPISLRYDEGLDSHLKQLRIGEGASPISISNTLLNVIEDFSVEGDSEFHQELKVSGNLYADNALSIVVSRSGFTYFRHLEEIQPCVSIRASSDGHGTLTFSEESGTILSEDGNLTIGWTGTLLFVDNGDQVAKMSDLLGTGVFQILNNSANTGTLSITVGANGYTDILTADPDGELGHIAIAPDGDLKLNPASAKTIITATDGLYFDGGTDTYIFESSSDQLRIVVGGEVLLALAEAGGGASDTFTTGGVLVQQQDIKLTATKKLYLDGGTDTYTYESAADIVRHVVGNDILLQLSEKGDDGNEVSFGSSCAGFTQIEPTYDATTTLVDFRHSNKQFVTFGSGNITNLTLIFPLVSGNFVCLLKQDGSGSRTITNYKALEFDESAADGDAAVKFAGGSNPTLTTDANHVDIISFYWDADNEIAYGVATLDFQF